MRRVVVTGLGLVTPLADGVEESWSRALAGQSGAGPIAQFDTARVITKYACEVKHGDGSNGTFNSDAYVEPKERRKIDDFILYGIAAIFFCSILCMWSSIAISVAVLKTSSNILIRNIRMLFIPFICFVIFIV